MLGQMKSFKARDIWKKNKYKNKKRGISGGKRIGDASVHGRPGWRIPSFRCVGPLNSPCYHYLGRLGVSLKATMLLFKYFPII